MSKAAVVVQDLCFGYPRLPNLIKSLTFEVQQGDIFAILGVNGCGKSTLIDLLLGQKNRSQDRLKWQRGVVLFRKNFQLLLITP